MTNGLTDGQQYNFQTRRTSTNVSYSAPACNCIGVRIMRRKQRPAGRSHLQVNDPRARRERPVPAHVPAVLEQHRAVGAAPRVFAVVCIKASDGTPPVHWRLNHLTIVKHVDANALTRQILFHNIQACTS